MKSLKDYLIENDISFAEFGERIGKDKSTVSRICAGKVSVDRDTARRIYEESQGAVTPNSLYGIDAPAATQDLQSLAVVPGESIAALEDLATEAALEPRGAVPTFRNN